LKGERLRFIVYGFELLSIGIFVITAFVTGLLVLRVIVSWATSNPFAWLPYHLRRVTEPIVQPLRTPFGRQYMRFDMIPLVAAIVVFGLGSLVSYLISRLATLLADINRTAEGGGLSGRYLAWWLIMTVGLLYEAAVFMRFFLPWVGIGYKHKFMRLIFKITEPFLRPLRRFLGQFLVMGSFDFTPMLALFLVHILTPVIAGFFK
jgi:uncharacterized protein YggT (Ycf19 family)